MNTIQENEPLRFKRSVRAVVEFIYRSGDITQGGGVLSDRNAMQAGSKIHRKLQKRHRAGYRAEVALAQEFSLDGCILTIEGRADGIEVSEDGVIIEEIKGIYRNLIELEAPVPVHLAQAKLYAAMYLRTHPKLQSIDVRMTYCNLETEELRDFPEHYERNALLDWLLELIQAYGKWIQWKADWMRKRNASIQGLEFPFPYRPGQKELVTGIYRTLFSGKELFVQAPTGVGKTMSAVFPAVHSLGQGLFETIFYLTAKTISRTVAEEAVALLHEKNVCLFALTLTAKEKICVQEECICDPEYCPRAKGHYDRISDALFDFISKGSGTRKELLDAAERYQVCPYALQMDAAAFVDMIICDYNYLFDPTAGLGGEFSETPGKHLLLIDEAHNLVDRGRGMFSAELSLELVSHLYRALKGRSVSLMRALGKCKRVLEDYKSEGSVGVRKEVTSLLIALMNLENKLEQHLAEPAFLVKEGELKERILQFYFQIHFFLEIASRLDEHYLIFEEVQGETEYRIELFCIDPSKNLQAALDAAGASIFFSATLLPISYYTSQLTTDAEAYRMYIPSPFASEHRLLLIGTDVSSRYKDRGSRTFEKIANYIQTVISAKRGNYIVFFPSYALMQSVAERMPQEGLLIQTQEMGEDAREDFLQQFTQAAKEQGAILAFCVMGGIFSEGIDLKEDALIGTIIVGTGLPGVDRRRELLREYYGAHGKDGFDFAYRYPGMNKVLQAAGRVIRTEKDRGIILLLDDRFAEPENRSLFPREWDSLHYVTSETVGGELERFWKKS